MRLNFLILLGLVLAGLALTYWLDDQGPPDFVFIGNQESATGARKDLPDFTITDLNGKHHKIADFKGKIVLLNFWATWCPPCVAEFPDLVDLAATNPDIVLIALSNDTTSEEVKTFLDRRPQELKDKLKSPDIVIAKDDRSKITGTIFETYELPETILIDRDGKMAGKIVGAPDWKSEEIKSRLAGL